MRSKLVASFSALLLAGCLAPPPAGPTGNPDPAPAPGSGAGSGSGAGAMSGGGGGDNSTPIDPVTPEPAPEPGPPAEVGTLSLMVASTSESLKLNDAKTIDVSVIPGGGFEGGVTYAVEGLPAGVTAAFDPPSGMVSAMTTVKLTLKTASDAMPANGTALTIKATSGEISATQPLTLDVEPELLIRIAKGVPIGTGANPNRTAFGGVEELPTIYVAPGTKVTWINEDGINHQIHSNGTLGIQHQGGPITANGGAYTDTLTGAGTLEYRCHIHPNMRGKLVVATPAQ